MGYMTRCRRQCTLLGVVSVVSVFFYLMPAEAQNRLGRDRFFLTESHSIEHVQEALIARADWHPYPKAGESGWEDVPAPIRRAHIEEGERLIGTEWESLPATVFLEYVRTGNRSNYQSLSYARRATLAKLALAEAIEDEGRFLDDIVNGIWSICEETYWGVPAHLSLQEAGPGLPDVAEPTVDLFAAETGSLLAWVDYLLGDRLDAVSSLIRDRIRYEIDRRILTPNLERDDFWWMGFQGGRINNWNPWVNSNWLTAVLLVESDEARRAQAVYKIMRSLDLFINSYPEDGGCDEGPGYWSRAAGSMFDTLDLLRHATGGGVDIFDRRLIGEMGRFIYRSYIAGPYFINFADAGARITIDPALVFRYGQAVKDTTMTGFAAYAAAQQQWGEGYIPGQFGHLNRQLPALFAARDLKNTKPEEPLLRDYWLRDIEVQVSRSVNDSREGFYFAAKGGHNNESHNHNDVGNVIVYHNGYPVLIDVGAGEYTARTFSKDRYAIWNMQSQYHNVPTVNGVQQKEGGAYRAHQTTMKGSVDRAQFMTNLKRAYPEEAALFSWVRTVTLIRNDRVEVRDEFELEAYTSPTTLNYMTPRQAKLIEPGKIVLDAPDRSLELPAEDVVVQYDPALLEAAIESIPLEDSRLRSGWGESLNRIVLTVRSEDTRGNVTVTVAETR